jgi:hypothetical protein
MLARLSRRTIAVTKREPHDPVGPGSELGIVRHQHQRGLRFPVQGHQQIDHAAAGLGIETPGGLVGEQDLRPVGERARDADPLLLAAGELQRIVVQPLGEPHPREQLARPLLVFAASPAGLELQRDEHVLERGERRHQLERLEHEPHALGAERGPLVLGEPAEVPPVETHRSLGGAVEARQQAEQGRLPAPGRPHHGDEALGLDR